jgi:hypothetical protein
MSAVESTRINEFNELLEQNKWDEINKYFLETCKWNGGSFEEIKYMVDHGANPRMEDDMPFVLACGRSKEIAQYFLNEHGARIDAQNNGALVEAAGAHRIQTMKMLLEAGIKVTPEVFKCICEYDGNREVEVLLEYGYDPQELASECLKGYILKNEIAFSMMKSFHKHGLDFNQFFEKIFKQ